MAFVDPTQPGQDSEESQNQSQVDQALNPSSSQQNQQQQQSQAAPPSTSSGGAGVASSGGSGGSSAPAVASGSKPSSSGSWTNLDSYLNANSDQATQLGQQVASNVNQTGQQAQSDISNLGNNFNQAVQQNTTNYNPDAVNQAVSDATSLKAGQNLDNSEAQTFAQQASGAYNGPNDLSQFAGFGNVQQSINDATQKAQATQTEAGRGSLLNDQFQNASQNGYTQGENNLDQLLLQNSQGAQAALSPLAQQWSGVSGALNSAVSQGSQAVQQAQATNAATGAQANQALSSANQGFQDQLNTGLANLKAKDTVEYNQELQNLQSGNVGPADWQNLGMSTAPDHVYGNGTTGVNLASYLQQNNTPTMANFANADQYAEAAALAELAGQGATPILSPTDVSQAGTAATSPAYNFNGTQFTSDNAAAQQTYQNSLNNVLSSVNKGAQLDNISIPGAGAKDIPTAVNYLNQIVQNNSNGSSMANSEKNWALSQLAAINQAQTDNGFQAYPIYGSTPVMGGTPPQGK